MVDGGSGSGSRDPMSTAPVPEVRVFVGDSAGRVKVLYTQSKRYETLTVPGCRVGSAMACQALACGLFSLPEPACVLVVARKNGTLDVIHVDQDAESGKLLCTIHEDRMRVGLERWVGLRLSVNGLFACTSGGSFRHVDLAACLHENAFEKDRVSDATCTWTIPSPLHHVAFYPPDASQPVTHVASGGEQVLLSIWSVERWWAHYRQPTEALETPSTPPTSKKRAAPTSSKHRELAPGEVWRAKNLPNDHLSLARPPMIRCIGFARHTSPDGAQDALASMRVMVGTKDGMLRVYEPSKKPRHVQEWPVVPKGQGSIRVLHAMPHTLLVSDTSRHLYMLDGRTGHVQFQYKDMTGTVSDVLTLHDSQQGRTWVLSASLDHLIRLFGTQRSTMLEQYFTGTDHAVSLVVDPQWTPPVPHNDDEDVWAHMSTVGQDASDDDSDTDADEASAQRAEKRHRRTVEKAV